MNTELQKQFYDLCEKGLIDEVSSLLNKIKYNFSVNSGLFIVCRKGNKELVNMVINFLKDNPRFINSSTYNDGLRGACLGKQLDLVELMINLGAWNLEDGFRCACEGGDLQIIQFFISKGIKSYNEGYYFAAKGGHKELLDFFSDKCDKELDIEIAFKYACEGGSLNIVQYFIEKGVDYSFGLYYACLNNHVHLINYFIKENNIENIGHGFVGACNSAHLNLVILMINSTKDDWEEYVWQRGRIDAKSYRDDKHQKIVEYIDKNKEKFQYAKNLNKMLNRQQLPVNSNIESLINSKKNKA